MIDFRYHLVSIIAVFFALAVGIVLGAGPLGERVEEDLPEQLAAANERNRDLQNQLLAFETAQDYQQGYIDSVADELVGERLSGRDVLVLSLPGADGEMVEQVRDMLSRSDATVTGTIVVEPSWTDSDSEAALDALAAELVSSESVLPEEGNGYDRGAAVLADAVMTSITDADLLGGTANGLAEELTDPGIRNVDQDALAGFQEAGFIAVNGEVESKATFVVAVAGTPEGEDAERRSTTMSSLLATLGDAGRGVVAAGDPSSTTEHGMLGVIRADEALAGEVSTVDSVELATGRIAVVYAVFEQDNDGVGHYGLEGTEEELLPPIPPRPGDAADNDEGNDDS